MLTAFRLKNVGVPIVANLSKPTILTFGNNFNEKESHMPFSMSFY